ncbi:MAG: BMP family protein [Planctomycetota bacterium]
MRPRGLSATVVLLILLCMASCQKETDDRFSVALVTPGTSDDRGWNAGAHDGLILIGSELEARIAHQVAADSQRQKEAFVDFAEEGYELVFGHGYEFQAHALEICKKYPDTIFISTSGDQSGPNFAPIRFRIEEATYLLGYLGARLSKSGQIAAVGGLSIPSIESSFKAYAAGAKAAREDIRVTTSYVGSFDDISSARESTLALLESGCDIIFQNANQAGLGVFKAVQEHGQGARAFGSNVDQTDVAPKVILASAVLGIPEALLQVARDVRDGQFKPEPRELDLTGGIVSVAFNPALEGEISPQLRSDFEDLRKRILSGEVKVPSGF